MNATQAEFADVWDRIRDDPSLANARRKLSLDEISKFIRHSREALDHPPKPAGETINFTAETVPYSSIVGGGLTLKSIDGRAAFIVNFIGTSRGITKEETAALADQFRWFVKHYGVSVPKREEAA